MKKSSIDTQMGNIKIDKDVLAQYAGAIAMECFGIVGMAALSKRDGIVKLLTRNSLTKGIQVTIEQNEIVIDFHVIVAYGVSIKTISDNLVDAVTYQVESATGFKVKKINILVEGVRVID